MQTYFYDIHWDRETLVDDEGTRHFDDGSAIYYARIVASRIARCGKGERVRVHVRDIRGRLLSIQCPGPLLDRRTRPRASGRVGRLTFALSRYREKPLHAFPGIAQFASLRCLPVSRPNCRLASRA